MEKPVRYDVFRQGRFVRSYRTLTSATRAADRMDAEYGAVCCAVRPVWED